MRLPDGLRASDGFRAVATAAITAGIVMSSVAWPVAAQDLPVNEVAGVATGGGAAGGQQSLSGFFSSRTPYEFWLTVLIIAFGVLTLTIVLTTFRRTARYHAEQLLRFATVLIIVVGTLVLITAGYNNEQVAPAFGLFGTIVGYILGRMSNAGPPTPDPPEDPATPPAGKG